MARPRMSAIKRQREQTRRERQQRKAEKRVERKRQEAENPPVAQQVLSPMDDGAAADDRSSS